MGGHSRHGLEEEAKEATLRRPALGHAQTQTLRAGMRASQCKTPKIALKGLKKAESSNPSKPKTT